MKRWHWFALAYVSIISAFAALFHAHDYVGWSWSFVIYIHGVGAAAFCTVKGIRYP